MNEEQNNKTKLKDPEKLTWEEFLGLVRDEAATDNEIARKKNV